MGALVVIILWLGINILIELCCGDKPKNKRQSIKRQQSKKQVIKTQEKIYDFDLFAEQEIITPVYVRKSA